MDRRHQADKRTAKIAAGQGHGRGGDADTRRVAGRFMGCLAAPEAVPNTNPLGPNEIAPTRRAGSYEFAEAPTRPRRRPDRYRESAVSRPAILPSKPAMAQDP